MPEYQADLRADPTLPWTDTEFLERTLARGMRFVPGAGWDYSNVGYLILRQLLQRVHAASFRDVLESTIFAPLGLRQTLVAESLADATILTPGWSSYLRADDELENIAPHYHPGWVSHGVVISTAAELATIVDALFAGRLLRPESLAAMKEPVILPFEHPLFRQPAYGLGLMIDTGSPHGLVAGHGGGGPGYSIGSLHFEHVNGSRVTSVALANRDAGDVGLRLAYELAMRVGSLRS
jgi:D-alanyl-D-alanine carboxypeptidase